MVFLVSVSVFPPGYVDSSILHMYFSLSGSHNTVAKI